MRLPSLFSVVVALVALAISACVREGIQSATECQFQAKNDVWRDYGFNLTITEPVAPNCPVKLDVYGQSISFAADVDAPGGTPLPNTPFFYRFFDADGFITWFGDESFARAANGRDVARITDRYLAGSAGDRTVNQDRVQTTVGVVQTTTNAINDTYLPYRCCGVTMSIGRVPRTRVGQKTTLRVFYSLPWPYTSSTPEVRWYRNGVFVPVGLTSPWQHPATTAALDYTHSSAGTYNWKADLAWGYPVQRKTLLFTQGVDP